MHILVPIGVATTLGGVALLVWCMIQVFKAKRAELPEDELRVVLQQTVVRNLAALCISAIGLMFVVLGIVFSS